MANYVITLEDIRNTTQYQEYRVQPGDEIDEEGNLIRKFSEDQEPSPVGLSLTAEDIAVNPWMQEEGVEPGDRYTEDKGIIKDRSGSTWEQFKYHYDKSDGLMGYALDAATIATGYDFWLDGDVNENYGEGFDKATPAERREMLYRAKERLLLEEYGYDFTPDKSSVGGTLGSIAGDITDPSLLIPFTKGIKGAVVGGAGLGAAYSGLEDYSKTGEVDPGKMAVMTVAGGALAGGASLAGKKLADRAARKTIAKVQSTVNKELASPFGSVSAASIPRLAAEAGVSERKLLNSLDRNKMKPEDLIEAAVPEFSRSKAITQDSAASRFYSPGVDKFLGVLSTQLSNISEPIAARLRRFEYETINRTKDYMARIRPFQAELKALGDSPLKKEISRELANAETNGFARAEELMSRVSDTMFENFKEVRKVLDELKPVVGLKEEGGLANYFPRVVRDKEGLFRALDTGNPKHAGPFKAAQAAYAAKNKIKVSDIPLPVRESINNNVVRGRAARIETPGPRFLKTRSVDVDNSLLPFYAEPEAALENYIRGAVNYSERNAFLGAGKKGKDFQLTFKEDGTVDLNSSIGSFVEKELASMSSQNQQKAIDLLNARFVAGETPLGKVAATVKEAGYLYTIAKPLSALVQLGDLAVTAAIKGAANTFMSLMLPKKVKLSQVMDDTISREFNDPSLLAKSLEATFKASGFKFVDRLAKETSINAAYRINRKAVRGKGEQAFRDKWKNTFPDNMDNVVDDLKNGRVTEDIKFLLFNELADLQPITLSELPPGYLTAGNYKLVYMLKSFMLKQIDIVRRNVVQQYKKGNKAKAAMTAIRLGAYLGASGVGIDQLKKIMSGQELSRVEDLPDEALWSVLSIYGLSKYTTERYLQRGEVTQAAANTLSPPLTLLDNIVKGVIDLNSEDTETTKILKTIPGFGNLAYMWFGGGAEKAMEQRERDRASE